MQLKEHFDNQKDTQVNLPSLSDAFLSRNAQTCRHSTWHQVLTARLLSSHHREITGKNNECAVELD
jgi:hypothetical protein